jgi:hypothetical protein
MALVVARTQDATARFTNTQTAETATEHQDDHPQQQQLFFRFIDGKVRALLMCGCATTYWGN